MYRATLRVIAGLFVGALLGWLLNDFSQDDRRRFISVDVDGPFSSEQMEQFRQEAKRRAMKEDERVIKAKQEFTMSVMSLVFIAMIFGMLAAFSLLFDLKAPGLQRNQVDELNS